MPSQLDKLLFTLMLLVITRTIGFTQSVGIGTTTPDVSSLLELNTTSKGFLPPRMTAAQKILIPSPKAGLIIYQTDAPTGLYIYDGISWIPAVTSVAGGWTTTGNAGTSPGTNFIGTTDNKSLLIKINNSNAGYLGLGGNTYWGLNSGNAGATGVDNIAIGDHALFLNSIRSNIVAIGDSALLNNGAGAFIPAHGTQNTAVGSKALYTNTTGYLNTALGYQSLYSNSTGYENSAVGSEALQANISGVNNTAMGGRSLKSNISGSSNTATGFAALFSNVNGHDNTANGYISLFANISGIYNTASGIESLIANTSGSYNTTAGAQSMWSNKTGVNNTANGYQALFGNIGGYSNVAIGFRTLYDNNYGHNNVGIGDSALNNNQDNFNTAIGSKALFAHIFGSNNTAAGRYALFDDQQGYDNSAFGEEALSNNFDGYKNTALGTLSLLSNTSGFRNAAVGNASLFNNNTGNYNTAIGNFTMQSNHTGSGNTALGSGADVGSDAAFNATAIGAYSNANCNNCMVLGSVNGTNVYGDPTSNINVGIGVNTPQTDLHINPNGAGSILIGTNRLSGGYTNLEMGISQQSGGYSYIQSTQASGSAYGNLILNPAGSNVGIRTTSPGAPLHIKQSNETYPVNGGGLRMERQTNTNHWDIGTDAQDDLDFSFNGITKTYLNNTSGGFTITSDLRLKKDIQLVGLVMPSLMQLQAKTYHYKDNTSDAKLSYGFIAQDVEKLFPDFVTTKGTDNIKGIAYQDFSVIAIKAIQEQQQEITAVKDENKAIMELIMSMQKELEELKQKIKQ